MSNGRKTSYDVILNPAALSGFVKLRILSAFSEHYNGLGMVRVWHVKHTVPKLKANRKSKYLASPLHGIGIWGPWEVCPSGQMVVNWQLKWDKDIGITGNLNYSLLQIF